MELRPLGPNHLSSAAAGRPPEVQRSPPASSGDVPQTAPADVVSVLRNMHPGDAATLLQVLEPLATADAQAQLATLVSSLLEHVNIDLCLADCPHIEPMVREIAQHSPATAEALPDHAALANIRAEVMTALHHITTAAKADAEHAVATANARIDNPAKPTGSYRTEPKALIDVCEGLISRGGLVNYRKAGNLAASLFDQVVPTEIVEPSPILDARGIPRRWPREFDLLPRGPALAGVLLVVVLLLMLAAYFAR